jgi:hypothetical protein
MPFQNGNRFAKGGKRPGSGRKSNKQKEAEQAAADVIRGILEAKAGDIARHALARLYENDQLLARVLEKIWPTVQKTLHSGNVIFNTNIPEDDD